MKKQVFRAIILCTLVTTSFLMGFRYGRSSQSPIQVTYTLAPPPVPAGDPFPIDINTAGKQTLAELPGIGPAAAQRILTYRQEHGKFRSVQELLNVDGIGTGKLEPILDLITVGG